jgi:hypothetical protein
MADRQSIGTLRKYDIGSVGFAKDGEYQGLMGEERIEFLRRFYRRQRLPAGWKPIKLVGPRTEITWNEVNWGTASERVTG